MFTNFYCCKGSHMASQIKATSILLWNGLVFNINVNSLTLSFYLFALIAIL